MKTPPVKTAYRAPRPLVLGTAAVASALLLLAGCKSPVKLDQNATPAPVESRNVSGGTAGSGAAGTTSGVGQSSVALVDASPPRQAPSQAAAGDLPRVVYFDFDSYVVREEYRNVIESNAKLLGGDRKKRVLIEGHTDDRGGREYNLALGQRRAEAVARSLTLLGVQDSQLEPVSFGKERPAQPGTDEAAWAKNRRAELKDRQ
jgi:peptidoglycan-associated lipoprotein